MVEFIRKSYTPRSGSRISPGWWRQPSRGRQHTKLPKCMKLKEFGLEGRPKFYYVDPPPISEVVWRHPTVKITIKCSFDEIFIFEYIVCWVMWVVRNGSINISQVWNITFTQWNLTMLSVQVSVERWSETYLQGYSQHSRMNSTKCRIKGKKDDKCLTVNYHGLLRKNIANCTSDDNHMNIGEGV